MSHWNNRSNTNRLNQKNRDMCSLLVSLPLLISYGAVAKQESSLSATYVFPQSYPSAQALFARSVDICDMFVGQLQIDLVSFYCRTVQVPQVAFLFTELAKQHFTEQMSKPIYIRCSGLKQRSAKLYNHNLYTIHQHTVYFTSVDVVTADDQKRFCIIEQFTEKFISLLIKLKLIESENVVCAPELFVVVRRFLNDPPKHPLDHYSQYVCEGVQLSEIRLVYSKGSLQCPVQHIKTDPRFSVQTIFCRPIVCDLEGAPARFEFAKPFLPSLFPTINSAVAYLSKTQSAQYKNDTADIFSERYCEEDKNVEKADTEIVLKQNN